MRLITVLVLAATTACTSTISPSPPRPTPSSGPSPTSVPPPSPVPLPAAITPGPSPSLSSTPRPNASDPPTADIVGVLYALDLVSECVVLAAEGEVWTVSWPPGYLSETTAEGGVNLIGPGGVIASAGVRVAAVGEERGMHPLCMVGSHFEVTKIVAIDHLADETGVYVSDELLVEFIERLSRAELAAFESRFGLEVVQRMYVSRRDFLFRIVDGTDPWEKRLPVGADGRVRRVNLNWLGTFF